MAFTLAALVLPLPATAFAGSKLQAVGAASIGYTDNVRSAPDPPIEGVAEREPGAFALISPGAVLAFSQPGVLQRMSYTYTASLFLGESDANSSSNRLDYVGFFDVSPRATLLFGASLHQSHLHSTGLLPDASVTPLSAAVPGTTAFVALRAEQSLSYELWRDYRLIQGVYGIFLTPLSDAPAARTYATGGRLGLERVWRTDAVGVEARADYVLVTDAALADGTIVDTQRQLVTTGVATWRHDWSRDFTSRVEAGVMRVQRLESGRGFWEPTGAAALGYATEDGDAELYYRHTATTSPLLGQSFIADHVGLRGGVPLAKEGEVRLSLSAGYQNGRLINEDATLATTLDLYLADAALGWQTTDELVLELRYQHAEQVSGARAPPLPLSFVRNTLLVGAGVTFPSDREMPRRYRAPRRVDRSDELTDAARSPHARGEP